MPFLYSMYQNPFWGFVGLGVVSIWTLFWKGFGLWHSAKRQQRNWFLAMLILNTAGLLPIIYLIWFKPEEKQNKNKTSVSVRSVSKKTKLQKVRNFK